MAFFLVDLIANMQFVFLWAARYTIEPLSVILIAFRLKSERAINEDCLVLGRGILISLDGFINEL